MEIHLQGNQHHKFQPNNNKLKGKKKSSSKNKFVGVRQRPSGRWVAEIKDTTKNIRMWLGTFETAEAAARAYDEAACLLRGSNTRTNFLNTRVSPNSALASRIKTLLTNKKSNDITTTTITPTKPSNTFSPTSSNNNNNNSNNFILTKSSSSSGNNSSNDNDVMHGNVDNYEYYQYHQVANHTHTKVVVYNDHLGTHQYKYSSSSSEGGDIISRPTDDLPELTLSQEIMMLEIEMMGKDEAIIMSPLTEMEKDIVIPASFCTDDDNNNNNNNNGFGEIHEQQVEFVDCFLHDDMIDPTVYGLWDLPPPAFPSFCSF